MAITFEPDEAYALRMDAEDPLAAYRDRFCIPKRPDGSEIIYFAGNSLGLLPTAARDMLQQELADWARLGVDGHFEGTRPWYGYHELFRETGARLVGARPGEVVVMNSLTVNLHLMMVSFYRPTKTRYRIMIDAPMFPSDTYAVKTQLQYHGYAAEDGLIVVAPRSGEHVVRTEDIEESLDRHGDQIALVMLGGVNFHTGQVLDMQRIAQLARRHGCVVGFDLAHAAGNIPLKLHDWQVDFAVWCNYKYLNSGPGAVGGCFVHQRHGSDPDLPRFGGWWGNDPATRFRMHLQPEFVPFAGADGWQISNPPIMAMAPVKASYDIFDEAGMDALREKSIRLTGYLEFLIDRLATHRLELVTPRDPDQRGCQLSLLVRDGAADLLQQLKNAGVVGDFRQPNIIRVAPTPLYNTFHEVWRFAEWLRDLRV